MESRSNPQSDSLDISITVEHVNPDLPTIARAVTSSPFASSSSTSSFPYTPPDAHDLTIHSASSTAIGSLSNQPFTSRLAKRSKSFTRLNSQRGRQPFRRDSRPPNIDLPSASIQHELSPLDSLLQAGPHTAPNLNETSFDWSSPHNPALLSAPPSSILESRRKRLASPRSHRAASISGQPELTSLNVPDQANKSGPTRRRSTSVPSESTSDFTSINFPPYAHRRSRCSRPRSPATRPSSLTTSLSVSSFDDSNGPSSLPSSQSPAADEIFSSYGSTYQPSPEFPLLEIDGLNVYIHGHPASSPASQNSVHSQASPSPQLHSSEVAEFLLSNDRSRFDIDLHTMPPLTHTAGGVLYHDNNGITNTVHPDGIRLPTSMSYSQIHTSNTQRSLLGSRHLASSSSGSGSTSQLIAPSDRSSIITTSANTQSIAESSRCPPTEDMVRGHDDPGQSLTTIKNVRDATVSGGFFVNTPGPVNFYGVSSRQPPDNDGNCTVATEGILHMTHDSGPTTPRSGSSDHPEYEIYCKYLLVKKRGTPLWEPGPLMAFPMEYRRSGVSIGDVGILDPTTGDFTYLFNMFLPADHEINEGRVPNGFIPLDKSKAEKTMKKSILRDRCLASSSLRRTDVSEFAFQTTGREGAVLVMPDGGLSEELQNYKLVEEYVVANAKSWWEYVESDDCGMQTEYGIEVVVGTDKVTSWGMATFENVEDTRQFEFKCDGIAPQTRDWKRINGRAGPAEEEIQDILTGPTTSPLRNQCVFVRTLNISISCKDQDKLAVVCPSCFRDCQCMPDQSRHQARQRNLPVSHPSKLLNKYLSVKYPNAKVVITRDSDWMSVITEDDTTMPSVEDLCARVLGLHTICEKEGVVTLEKQEKIVSTGATSHPSAITTAHQQTTSEDVTMSNERDASVVACLLLETSDERSTGPLDYKSNFDELEEQFDDPFLFQTEHDTMGVNLFPAFDPNQESPFSMGSASDVSFGDPYDCDMELSRILGLKPPLEFPQLDPLNIFTQGTTSASATVGIGPLHAEQGFPYLCSSSYLPAASRATDDNTASSEASSSSSVPKPSQASFDNNIDPQFEAKKCVYKILTESTSKDEAFSKVIQLAGEMKSNLVRSVFDDASQRRVNNTLAGQQKAKDRRVRSPTFVCILCPNQFTTNKNLQNHYRSHLQMDQHRCPRCGDYFRTEAIRKRHTDSSQKCRRLDDSSCQTSKILPLDPNPNDGKDTSLLSE